MSQTLKPCPWCGQTPETKASNTVECANVNCVLHHNSTYPLKPHEWNTRAVSQPEDAQGTEPDELERQIARAVLAEEKLAQLEAAQTWRPIQIAPRDGTPVLVTVNGKMFVAHYSPSEALDFTWCYAELHGIEKCCVPTHWMPLPAALST